MATTQATVPTKSLAERIDANREAIRAIVRKYGYLNPRVGRITEDAQGCDFDFAEPETAAWRGKVDIIADLDPDANDVPMFAFGGIMTDLSDLLQAQVSVVSTRIYDAERGEKRKHVQPV